MSLLDRDYMRRPPTTRRSGLGQRIGLHPEVPYAVWTLIGVNLIVFLLEGLGPLGDRLVSWGVMQPRAVLHGEVWRLLSATYLHAGVMHVAFNMLGLYFLGPPLERRWGPWRFLALYTAGGVLANGVLALAGLTGYFPSGALALGASGSVLTVVGATAVLYPRAEVWIFGILPMKLGVFAALYGALFVFNVLQQGGNYGGDMAHLVGLLIGAGWARFGPWAELR